MNAEPLTPENEATFRRLLFNKGTWSNVAVAEIFATLDRERAEVERLKSWQREMLAVTPPMQEIGHALGLGLGESIHDKILPGIVALKAELATLRSLLAECRGYVAEYKCENVKDEMLARIDAMLEKKP